MLSPPLNVKGKVKLSKFVNCKYLTTQFQESFFKKNDNTMVQNVYENVSGGNWEHTNGCNSYSFSNECYIEGVVL